MTTGRQRAAVYFCEQWLNVTFTGNINNKVQVSLFLGEYLQEAKNLYDEIRCEYEAYLWIKQSHQYENKNSQKDT